MNQGDLASSDGFDEYVSVFINLPTKVDCFNKDRYEAVGNLGSSKGSYGCGQKLWGTECGVE